jgi:PD-(D/E)XK nuclease superfamily
VALATSPSSSTSMYTVTASAADNYADCPLRHWSQKAAEGSDRDPDRFSHGNAVHAVLKSINMSLVAQRPFPSLDFILERLWNPSFFKDSDREHTSRLMLPDTVNIYRNYLEDGDRAVLAAEQFLTTPPRQGELRNARSDEGQDRRLRPSPG